MTHFNVMEAVLLNNLRLNLYLLRSNNFILQFINLKQRKAIACIICIYFQSSLGHFMF